MTKQGIIAAIKECAQELGRSPSFIEVWKRKEVSRKQIRWHFGDYRKALKACGLEARHGGYGSQIELGSLFKDWARVVRLLKKIPSMPEFIKLGKYSQTPLLTKFGVWGNVAPGMKMAMKQKGWHKEWRDVLVIIEEHLKAKEQAAGKRFRAEEKSAVASADKATKLEPPIGGDCKTKVAAERRRGAKGPHSKNAPRTEARTWRTSRTIQGKGENARETFGQVMRCGPMLCAPTNEQGVLLLFGALAEKLGFAVLKVRSAFPDCMALMRVDEETCELVKVEFEFLSRNFVRHMHEKSDADILVCWKHNWTECPLEVVELSRWF